MSFEGNVTLIGQRLDELPETSTEPRGETNVDRPTAEQAEADELYKAYQDTINELSLDDHSYTDLSATYKRLTKEHPSDCRTEKAKALIADYEDSMETERSLAKYCRKLKKMWDEDTVQYATELGERRAEVSSDLDYYAKVAHQTANHLSEGLQKKARILLEEESGG